MNRRYVKRNFIEIICLLVLNQHAVLAGKVSGYITRVTSNSKFDIGDLHVVVDEFAQCTVYPPVAQGDSREGCKPTVFSRVLLSGKMKRGDKVFVADKITILRDVHLIDRRNSFEAILQEPASLTTDGNKNKWHVWIDGYPASITDKTKMYVDPDNSILYFGYRYSHGNIFIRARTKSKPGSPTQNPPRENMYVVYKAIRAQDRSITIEDLQYWPNFIDKRERKFNARFLAKVVNPDFVHNVYGSIQYPKAPAISILPDRVVQNYVSEIGNSLIPIYQKNLPNLDPTKIHFRFYAVRPFPALMGKYFVKFDPLDAGASYQVNYWTYAMNYWCNKPNSSDIVENVVSDPDGMVLIPDTLLVKLNNSSQLAAFISVAMTSVIQKQEFNNLPQYFHYLIYAFPGVNEAWQIKQAIRIGIRQMYLSGYDMREAPFAWEMNVDRANLMPHIAHGNSLVMTPFWYAPYAFNYISQYYQDVDYSKLKRGEREYQQFLQELYKADPSLPRPKAQLEPQAQLESQPQLKPQAQSRPVCTPTQAAKDAACMGHSATQGTAQPTPQSSATPANSAPKQAPAQAATAH